MRKRKAAAYFPLVMVLVFLMFLLISSVIHFSSSYRLARSVEERLLNAVIDSAVTNWANMYSSVREGYTGSYSYNLNAFTESITYTSVRPRLNEYLNCDYDGSKHDDNGKLIFSISNVSVSINNCSYKNGTLFFNVNASAKLKIPQDLFGYSNTVEINIDAKSTYSKLF